MATSFKQYTDNAGSSTTTSMTGTGVTSIAVTTAEGAKFPLPGNGFRVTLWNSATYAEPGLDPNMEIVTCSARVADTLTISATSKTHTSPTKVDLLLITADLTDMQTAINAVENLTLSGTPWTAYTPAWTALTTNPTLGNGSITGSYQRIADTIFYRIKVLLGSTSTVGVGQWRFSLPVAASSNFATPGTAGGLATSVGNWYGENPGVVGYGGNFVITNTTTIAAQYTTSTGQQVSIGPGNPGTWASTWYLQGSGIYEAA